MRQCEYCGRVRCQQQACIEALLANAAYYDAEAKLRAATIDRDVAKGKRQALEE